VTRGRAPLFAILLGASAAVAACAGASTRTSYDEWPGARTLQQRPAGKIIIGHRGASGHAPENTLSSFELALRLGADYFEPDIYLTRDGVPIVLHDATLNRTARGPAENCTGKVSEKTLDQLRTCNAGIWFNERRPEAYRAEFAAQKIPTLEEVFHRFGRRAGYWIEIKSPQPTPGVEAKVAALLEQYGLRGDVARRRQVIVQSFDPQILRTFHEIAPEVPLVQLISARESSEAIRARLAEIAEYAVGIGPEKGTVDAALVQAAHARGLGVYPYTVNDPAEMRALLDMGVDGIISDYPDRVAQVMGRSR
jgi:glycerophosphoryl diester phosphodiesterase